MIVKTSLTEIDLENIAKEIGLQFNNFKQIGKNSYIFTLKHSTIANKNKFVRIGFHRKKFNGVCLHGYTLFMAKVLQKDYKAKFISSLYKEKITIDNISDAYSELYHKNIGSILKPLYFGDACHCDANDIIDVDDAIIELSKTITRG